MKKNILYQALFALGIVISMPCEAASLNKQMSAAKTSPAMAQVIQKAAKSKTNSQWIELNIDRFINQIDKEIRSGKTDENTLLTILKNTKQALNNMPQGKGKKLANKLDDAFGSLGLKIYKDAARTRGAAETIEIEAGYWNRIHELYQAWLEEEQGKEQSEFLPIPDEISAEIATINQQTGEMRTLSKYLWDDLETFRDVPSSEEPTTHTLTRAEWEQVYPLYYANMAQSGVTGEQMQEIANIKVDTESSDWETRQISTSLADFFASLRTKYQPARQQLEEEIKEARSTTVENVPAGLTYLATPIEWNNLYQRYAAWRNSGTMSAGYLQPDLDKFQAEMQKIIHEQASGTKTLSNDLYTFLSSLQRGDTVQVTHTQWIRLKMLLTKWVQETWVKRDRMSIADLAGNSQYQRFNKEIEAIDKEQGGRKNQMLSKELFDYLVSLPIQISRQEFNMLDARYSAWKNTAQEPIALSYNITKREVEKELNSIRTTLQNEALTTIEIPIRLHIFLNDLPELPIEATAV
ncbi:MAG TPA: hypothetical protein VGT41_04750 [Candidatus Babeliales bacterium]|nr:hypothetical protein [Candidatus Babeliales bacterium]